MIGDKYKTRSGHLAMITSVFLDEHVSGVVLLEGDLEFHQWTDDLDSKVDPEFDLVEQIRPEPY